MTKSNAGSGASEGTIEDARRLHAETRRPEHVLVALVALGTIILLFGCGAGSAEPHSTNATVDSDRLGGALCKGDQAQGIVRPAHWTEASHCKGVEPDYGKLFEDQVVHRLDVTIHPAVYEQAQDDLEQLVDGVSPSGAGDGPGFPSEDPIWVPAKIAFDGKTWDQVGMRYKGNSSLVLARREGVKKLPFRLSFDKFEDDHPELTNQRFYGFKKMTFSSGFHDDSLLRDKLAADIFRDGGIPAARGAFARVYVDAGGGPVYFGLYTMIEDPSDELLEAQFGDGSGNLYKPEGHAADWRKFNRDAFPKKTNEDEADWSDIEAAVAALHAASRTADPATWREELERVFDTRHFLRWLAINQAMEAWDSYGRIAHNYYVYGDPSADGVLRWVPWDLNAALCHSERGQGAQAGSVALDEVGEDWPLIRFLLDDEVYREVYRSELKAAVEGCFSKKAVQARLEAYHALIAPYVVGDDGEKSPHTCLPDPGAFEDSVARITSHVASRHEAVAKVVGP